MPGLNDEWKEKYPAAFEWHARLMSRPGVKAAQAKREKNKAASGQGSGH